MGKQIRYSLTLIENWWRTFHISVRALNAPCLLKGLSAWAVQEALLGPPLALEHLLSLVVTWAAVSQACAQPRTSPTHLRADIPAWPWPIAIPMTLPSHSGHQHLTPVAHLWTCWVLKICAGWWGSYLTATPRSSAHTGQHLPWLLSSHYMELTKSWKYH